jgi:cytochrome P450
MMVCHPDDVHHVLVNHSRNYLKGDDYKKLEPVLGCNSLVTIRDEDFHSKQRRAVSAAFSPMALKEIANNIINRRIGWAMEKLDTDVEVSVRRWLIAVCTAVVAAREGRRGLFHTDGD